MTTRTPGVKTRIESNELWPEDANTNKSMHPKYTQEQKIEKATPSQIQTHHEAVEINQ